MILLDTNVVSEPLKPRPDPKTVAWLDRQAADTLYLASTSLAELLLGVELLPQGKRKVGFRSDLTILLARLFGSRILPFDQAAAAAYASIISRSRAKGRAIAMADGQIAAIAHAHGVALATRDTSPFLAAGIAVIDPWNE